ncbi:hypothetical protein [Halomonas sp. M20]|uniref:hypothetical protein n=1 Tax=Halomonas sp. M20 TaxID=2763264 RepID=UPI001D09C5AA|nr:hypothetical protein [Halomonas sp. M20]
MKTFLGMAWQMRAYLSDRQASEMGKALARFKHPLIIGASRVPTESVIATTAYVPSKG